MYGVQGGMTCGLVPTYLSEISPPGLRGATGVVHQLFLTIGIWIAQTLGFRQLLGTAQLWHFLLALPIVPGLLGSLALLVFFAETPRALLLNNRDEQSARRVLASLRASSAHNDAEIEEMRREAAANSNANEQTISLTQLFTLTELRWPLVTGIVLQLTQQLCGINAIFFYSEGIFRSAGIQAEHIQYAIFSTGAVNVLMTIVCVPLIDRLGRKVHHFYPFFMLYPSLVPSFVI
jgi:SP family facilitated glucose transporter-like MFS transporter 1